MEGRALPFSPVAKASRIHFLDEVSDSDADADQLTKGKDNNMPGRRTALSVILGCHQSLVTGALLKK